MFEDGNRMDPAYQITTILGLEEDEMRGQYLSPVCHLLVDRPQKQGQKLKPKKSILLKPNSHSL
jgi:hypothetical protein